MRPSAAAAGYAATANVMHRTMLLWGQHCISTSARASSSCPEHQPRQLCCTNVSGPAHEKHLIFSIKVEEEGSAVGRDRGG
jgi:hypothetical protein